MRSRRVRNPNKATTRVSINRPDTYLRLPRTCQKSFANSSRYIHMSWLGSSRGRCKDLPGQDLGAASPQGCNLAIFGRNAERLADVEKRCLAGGVQQVRSFACDIKKVAQLEQTAQDILTAFNGVDILINNAGGGTRLVRWTKWTPTCFKPPSRQISQHLCS